MNNIFSYKSPKIISFWMIYCILLYSFLSTSVLMVCAFSQSPKADVAFMNGKIYTVDKKRLLVRAVACLNGKIIAVGMAPDIQPYIDPATTKVIDLKGKLMLPGFIDNHTHMLAGGFRLTNVNLRDANNESEFAQKVKEYSDKQPPGKWIVGGDWDNDRWPTGELPSKELIDIFTPDQPVIVSRYDGHMVLANSVVLEMAGITKATPNPPGGEIVHDAIDGEPTGVLKDAAMDLVLSFIPPPGEKETIEAMQHALAEARRYGLTSVQDISDAATLRALQAVKAKGELTTRFYCRMPVNKVENFINTGIAAGFGDEWIRVGAMKASADGSLGGGTALFFEPYESNPNTSGLASDILQDGRLEQWAIKADSAHLQIGIEATGDKANSLVLDIFQKIVRANPNWERRFRIEHAQNIDAKDIQRFFDLDVTASVQPYHIIDEGRWAEKRIGKERSKNLLPLRTLIDKRIRLSFGSDWTAAPLNPLMGIYAAVTRRTIDGKNTDGWMPEQKITVKEAIEAYTLNSAYSEFSENEKGSITVGKFADFVVLSDDILTIDPMELDKIQVEMTIVSGNVVYQK